MWNSFSGGSTLEQIFDELIQCLQKQNMIQIMEFHFVKSVFNELYINRYYSQENQMGGECSSLNNSPIKQFQFLKQQVHESLGKLKVVRKISNNSHMLIDNLMLIGVKQVYFHSSIQCNHYKQYLEQIKQFDNIPTLVKILSYQFNGISKGAHINLCSNQQETQNKQQTTIFNNISRQLEHGSCASSHGNCSTTFGQHQKITLFIQYHESSLQQMLNLKKSELRRVQKSSMRYESNVFNFENNKIKLCDYDSIDRLGYNQRKLVNLYYQEIQVLRMIDHIIGALYFLHHFGHGHRAVRPSNILIDNEGKYILVDSKIFQLEDNYSKAITYIEHKKEFTEAEEDSGKIFLYLSPQLYANLSSKQKQHHLNFQKSDIFAVGMIALQMCLLERDIHSLIVNRQSIHIMKSEITKMLLSTRNRYSNQLVELLKDMLDFNPGRRIDYSRLIDRMQPLLNSNIDKIQKLYKFVGEKHQQNSSNSCQIADNNQKQNSQSRNLVKKMMQFNKKYEQVMRNSFIVSEKYEPFNREAIISDQQYILKQLKKIKKKTKAKNSGVHIIGSSRQKQIKSTDLYDLYLNQYKSIKSTKNI